jgi:hypothetical protein
MPWFFTIFCLLLTSCSDSSKEQPPSSKGQSIFRKHDEFHYRIDPPSYHPIPRYPWEEGQIANLHKITKEFFRCNGSLLNPEKMIDKNGKLERLFDCGGSDKHGLPLRDGQEFIYPILPTLLNYLQAQTGKRVVITSGHRCPDHNRYVDSSKENLYSKHQIGAEASFYVQGLEERPELIVQLLLDYYKENTDPELNTFLRYEKSDTNVSIQPWYNKEIYIKLFKPDEGRNFDNRHPYPYVAVQVRYDNELKERVFYNWDKAYKNYLRK